MRERRAELADAGFGIVAVGFSPPDALAELADHLGWDDPFCSDLERRLYHRLGIGQAPLARVFNAGTLARYRAAALARRRIRRPVEDVRQLGGDALVVEGVVRSLALPRTPDDRTSVEVLARAARTLAQGS